MKTKFNKWKVVATITLPEGVDLVEFLNKESRRDRDLASISFAADSIKHCSCVMCGVGLTMKNTDSEMNTCKKCVRSCFS